MDQTMNPAETGDYPRSISRPTVEYRSPDGSAFPHLLLAAMTVCVQEGLLGEDSLQVARELEVAGNIFAQPLNFFAQSLNDMGL